MQHQREESAGSYSKEKGLITYARTHSSPSPLAREEPECRPGCGQARTHHYHKAVENKGGNLHINNISSNTNVLVSEGVVSFLDITDLGGT